MGIFIWTARTVYPQYITPISMEEYNQEMGEDEEDIDDEDDLDDEDDE